MLTFNSETEFITYIEFPELDIYHWKPESNIQPPIPKAKAVINATNKEFAVDAILYLHFSNIMHKEILSTFMYYDETPTDKFSKNLSVEENLEISKYDMSKENLNEIEYTYRLDRGINHQLKITLSSKRADYMLYFWETIVEKTYMREL